MIPVTRPRELGPPRGSDISGWYNAVRLCRREYVVEFVGVADLAGARRRVGCHRVAEAHGERNLVGVSWICLFRLERSEVG